ncbi:B3/B4 domain-containing protein [Oceanibacterium hippocampi]|uniref:B3/4 domain protein n=1 Tax=Oceanibacterium hippocampi TaxID=745714 RepID=A0A1Y5S8U2_9PROT|nr:phenylalanine--tRNA ligase beta subunit-related protein [Oceanibacterium hippocampi]SLN35065.1 B3/4 domain protein [Oceanibacterium hippocampi]
MTEQTLTIADIVPRFPETRIALVLAGGLAIAPERSAALAAEIAEAEAAAPTGPVSAEPRIAAWREAYKGFGIRKTSYRCSVERLLRSVQAGRGLPRINSLVDCYNAVSLRHLMPLGADDADRLDGQLAFRYARPGDSFRPLGGDGETEDPPKDGEVVYADAAKILCRRWNWYQDARSAVSPDSRLVVLTVQAMAPAPLEDAVADLAESLSRHCGARTAHAIADADSPTVTVSLDR